MAAAISRGLTLSDFKKMTIGQIVDYCITYNEMTNSGKEENNDGTTIRKATQADFNNF